MVVRGQNHQIMAGTAVMMGRRLNGSQTSVVGWISHRRAKARSARLRYRSGRAPRALALRWDERSEYHPEVYTFHVALQGPVAGVFRPLALGQVAGSGSPSTSQRPFNLTLRDNLDGRALTSRSQRVPPTLPGQEPAAPPWATCLEPSWSSPPHAFPLYGHPEPVNRRKRRSSTSLRPQAVTEPGTPARQRVALTGR